MSTFSQFLPNKLGSTLTVNSLTVNGITFCGSTYCPIRDNPLGSRVEGGFLLCRSSTGLAIIVAPCCAEVRRNWYNSADANTVAQACTGCTGWFVPSDVQLQNPGYGCRVHWDSYCDDPSGPCYYDHYWSDTEVVAIQGAAVCFSNGIPTCGGTGKGFVTNVRSFRCVSY